MSVVAFTASARGKAFWIALWLAGFCTIRAQVFISEVLCKPVGSDDTNEYLELRGPPNAVLPNGTYFVAVDGDADGNPGTVLNVFDLSGRAIGQNGFILLLQRFHRYVPNPLATVLTNSDNSLGWGTGGANPVRHRGRNGSVALDNPSVTFLLVQTARPPDPGDDIDPNDDGVPDGDVWFSWIVFDSVGILDNGGRGDAAYGLINFRRDAAPGNGASATGTIVSLPFTPAYVARRGHTTGWSADEWVAGDDLDGRPPRIVLDDNDNEIHTFPLSRARSVLNHLGAANFGALPLPSILLRQTGTNTAVTEGRGADTYLLNPSLAPTGAVTVLVRAAFPLQISSDGRTFADTLNVVFTRAVPRTITVRAPDDRAAGPPLRRPLILHSIGSSADARFPPDLEIASLPVAITDTNVVLLSEVKVNPPGAEDVPFEFVELRGPANALLTNLYLVALQGDSDANPGLVELALDLTGQRLGANGLLVVAGAAHPYVLPPATAVFLAPQFSRAGGALGNGSLSILLVGSTVPITEGADLDRGDNGKLESLPNDAFIADAVGWTGGGNRDRVYGGVDLTQRNFVPDAAARLPRQLAPRSAAAWMAGDLAGTTGNSLTFDDFRISANFPGGSILSPGVINKTAPFLTMLPPLSHVIGDPDNPAVHIAVSDDETPVANLRVTATSTNPTVVPDSNLRLTRVAPGRWTLTLNPIGVGYSDIVLTVSDGTFVGRRVMHYAASEFGRPGAKWLTGVSDASTAIRLDANWMLVGDDENQTIRLYSRTRSGAPVAGFNFDTGLRLTDTYPDGSPKEVDIEGSTRVGNRIYWLGSHSHSAEATERTNRARLFATDSVGSGTNIQLRFLSYYSFLKVDLIDWDQNNRHGLGANYFGLEASAGIGIDPKASDGSGFNFEGLCMAPSSTTVAYVAFRAPFVPPTTRSRALIVPVINFTQLATGGGPPGSAIFGRPIELDLGCRGIRSIEGVGTNYLIVAGPPGPATGITPSDFRLFTWSGRPNDPPQERAADLTELLPEAIVELPPTPWTTNSMVQLLSDNGIRRYYGDDVQAKFLPIREFKKFRADWVKLGPVVAPTPSIRSHQLVVGMLTLTWCSAPGHTYRVQCTATIRPANWIDVPGDVTASDAFASKTFPVGGETQCFYRVVAIGPAR